MDEWWRGAVIYQIYPRSFFDTSRNGVGDLPGITARLDYVKSLGVDAIWMSPFYRSPMRDFGYDVSNHTDIDPLFGTLEDFDMLVAAARARQLKLVIDQVYSHSSDEAPWFAESRASRTNDKADWYVWADAGPAGEPPNNWQSIFGGSSWTWDARRRQYYLHNFLSCQPDFNIENPEVQDALIAVLRFWIERGVDGFRLDAVNMLTHNRALTDNPPSNDPDAERPYFMQAHVNDIGQPATIAFLQRLRRVLDERDGLMSVAVVFEEDPLANSLAYSQGTDRLHTAYNFSLLNLQGAPTAAALRMPLERWYREAGEAWPSWSFSNHDVPRVLTRWGGPAAGPDQAKLYLAILLTLRGTIFLYQGEELGLPQAHIPFEALVDPEGIANWPATLGRDGCRTPMPWDPDLDHCGFSVEQPWLPLPFEHRNLSVATQEQDATSTLATARMLLALRQHNAALRHGDLHFVDTAEPVLAYQRRHRGKTIICLFNLGEEPQIILKPPAAIAQTLIAHTALADAGTVQLGPYGFFIGSAAA